MRFLSGVFGSAAMGGMILVAAPAGAQTYRFMPQDFNRTLSTLPEAINASNTVVGNVVTNDGGFRCYVRNRTTHSLLNDPAGGQVQCYGINASGSIVGALVSGKVTKGFVYSGGVFTAIRPPGTAPGGAVAYGISDSGLIIGGFTGSDGIQHGFILANRTYKDFSIKGAVATLGIGINDNGQYTVQSEDSAGNSHSWLCTAASTQELVFPQATSTAAHAINNKGEVALGWVDSSGNQHGGLYDSNTGIYYTEDSPGAAFTAATGINDAQTMVGIFYLPTDSVYEGFIARGHVYPPR